MCRWLIYRAKRQGLKEELIFDFILLALPIAIICARGYYVIFEWDSYSGDTLSIFKIWKGGLAIYGGVIGSLITAILFCRHHKFPLFQFLDLVVPSLVVGQAIGRWGNFVNQETFENIVAEPSLQFFPFAVYIDAPGEWHQATFFYESMWNVCLLTAMLIVSRKKTKDRHINLYVFCVLWFGKIFICCGILLYVFLVRRNKTKNMYSGKYVR